MGLSTGCDKRGRNVQIEVWRSGGFNQGLMRSNGWSSDGLNICDIILYPGSVGVWNLLYIMCALGGMGTASYVLLALLILVIWLLSFSFVWNFPVCL